MAPVMRQLRELNLVRPPQRIISLVPSITESLFDLGFGERVVGISDFCIYPAEGVLHLPRVGGPKNARVADILKLEPDLVIANQEENTPRIVNALADAAVPVWLTFPQTVAESIAMLWEMVDCFGGGQAEQALRLLEMATNWCGDAAIDSPCFRYFCPIWQDGEGDSAWWMTFNAQTYPHDLLQLLGGDNIFANRARQYPLAADLGRALSEEAGGRDTRYPRVTRAEIIAGQPDVILLPSEPYDYGAQHSAEFLNCFADTPAGRNQRILLVDGTLLMWCGTRLGKALVELPAVLR